MVHHVASLVCNEPLESSSCLVRTRLVLAIGPNWKLIDD